MSTAVLEDYKRIKAKHREAFGNYNPHRGQVPIHADNHRFRTACCGRRFGKTIMAVNETSRKLKQRKSSVGWWVSPIYPITNKGWREFLIYCPPEEIGAIHKTDKVIEMTYGASLWFKSADKPDSLLSEGLDWLVLDEAAVTKADAWERSLRPALADKKGEALFISTPRGKNWFNKLYLRGLSGNPNYKSFTFPTSANPYIDDAEIAEVKSTLPDMVFRQEFLAEFVDDAGAVFRNIRACIGGSLEKPFSGETYKVGVDIAKERDFTVATVIKESTGQVVAFDRYQHISYDMVLPRINELGKRYKNAEMLLDSTGVGDPIFDMLAALGANVKPYKFTNPSKENLVRGLMVALENQEISYPEIDVLIGELEAFEYKTGTSGVTRYGAPDSLHDDCVISLALAVEASRGSTNGLLDYFKQEEKKPANEQGYSIEQLQRMTQ